MTSRNALILSLPGRLLEEMGLELEAWESRVIVEHAEWAEVGGARCQRGPGQDHVPAPEVSSHQPEENCVRPELGARM